MVNVTPGPTTGDAEVSWYWDGDGYGGVPHNPCSGDGYTPPGQNPCDEMINPPAVVPACTAPVVCWEDIATEPNNGRMDNAVVSYNGLIWSITGYGLNTDVRYYNPTNDTWTSIPGSGPGFGYNYARSGAVYGSKAFVYGDAATPGFTGLWSYDMNANVWTNETPSGTPPVQTGIWAPAWVADPQTGYLYMTGGATTPGGGNLSTVYVYNPVANAWLAPLPNFTSQRDFHAAYIFVNPANGHKMLAVAGGVNTSSVDLASTQCYDFVTGTWNAENADIPALPYGWWGMGYAHNVGGTGHQLWLVGGVYADYLYTGSGYYDFSAGSWVDGGNYAATAVYRTSAVALHGEVYKISGSIGSFSYTDLSSKYVCAGPPVPVSNWALFIGIGLILVFAVVRFRKMS
jgi:hypothetical protein